MHRVLFQISDTHLLAEGLVHGRVDTHRQLAEALERIEAFGVVPDLLLFSGDLADGGAPAAYRRLRALVEPAARRWGCPVCYLPGNHDDREALRSVLLDEPGEGPLDQVLWAGGLRLVALDTTVPGHHHGRLGPGQLAWLATVLAEPAPEGTLLALHHPPLYSPVRISELLGLHDREALAGVIAGTDVCMVVAGHTHHCAAGQLGGVPVWVSGATAYQADVLAGDDLMRSIPGLSFTRIDVHGGRAVASAVAVVPGAEALSETDVSGVEGWLSRTGALDPGLGRP